MQKMSILEALVKFCEQKTVNFESLKTVLYADILKAQGKKERKKKGRKKERKKKRTQSVQSMPSKSAYRRIKDVRQVCKIE